ncbi:MAG: aldehyde dehydrogenase family protein [Chloroflexota bacterium]|nr:MAG: aldehyde dehydrogenase family protein [Chloroflexota bacterium]
MAYKNYVDGKWVDSVTGESFESRNPAETSEVIATVPKSDRRDVDAAVQSAARAFPGWRKLPAPRRGEILFRAAEIMVQRKEELASLMTREMGKVIKEARGDVQEAIDMTYYMAGEGRRLFGQTVPSELPNKFAMSVRDPIGVIAAITPWNFPLAIPTWKVMPALIAGNTVVFKPASDTPILAIKLVEILEEAGLPGGVLNMVTGPGSSTGMALVTHPGVQLISFTGSRASANEVSIEGAHLGKRVSLESGGKNAIIVMDDANLDLAVDGVIWSAFGTTGQRCTACSRLIVQRGVADQLVSRIVERARALRLGSGHLPETDMGPLINESQLRRVGEYVEIAKSEGAKLLTGGQRATGGQCANGYFFEPTVFVDVTPRMRIAQEEIFGPVLAVITVDSLEEAIQINNDTQYGLSSAIFTSDVNKAYVAIRDLSTGLVYVNAGTIGAEVQLPFGGTRGTGNGHREAGQAALDIFSEWKSVFVDFSGKLQRAQIDNS